MIKQRLKHKLNMIEIMKNIVRNIQKEKEWMMTYILIGQIITKRHMKVEIQMIAVTKRNGYLTMSKLLFQLAS
jgi:hypothetical protein